MDHSHKSTADFGGNAGMVLHILPVAVSSAIAPLYSLSGWNLFACFQCSNM